MSLQKLPAGIQIFDRIREEDYIYIDKTKYLVEMIDNGYLYFLARPRRFGKSLTCSTFEALFQGKKELFKGLYAEEFLNRPNFKPSPVIRLDMNGVSTSEGLDGLKKSILFLLDSVAERLGVKLKNEQIYSDAFKDLIEKAHNKYGERVTLLIDEYDYPYLKFFDKPDMASKIRKILQDFYTQIKTSEQYLKFIFITGITKTTKMGIFSTLNNITDISLNKKYGKICGLTKGELKNYFTPYLEDVAKEMQISLEDLLPKIKSFYDGFCFDGEHYLYNPYSFIRFLEEKKFLNYWIHTGSPSFLAEYLKNRNLTVEQFREMPVDEDFIYNPPAEIEVAPPESFLLQSGYLSLRKNNEGDYCLDYPNTEVLNSMSQLLAQNILSAQNKSVFDLSRLLHKALSDKKAEDIVDVFNSLLASIPHNDFDGAARQDIKQKGYEMTAQEWLCRSCLFAFLQGCGVVVSAEVQSSKGRADLIILHKGNYFVIEIKMLPSTAKQALQQIIDNNYVKPYPNAIILGVAIDGEKRQITDFEKGSKTKP